MSRTLHVLVVEDEGAAREALRRLLVERFSVDVAENGEAALAIAATHWPDIVVTDLRMPGMGGIELTTKLHEIDAALPVIVASVIGDVSSVVEAMRSGASDYLIKPIDFGALSVAIDRQVRETAESKQRDVSMRDVNTSLVEHLIEADRSIDTMREVAEFRERLISIISHDLRNPLSAILMAASLLHSGGRLNDVDESLAMRITSSGRRMKRIVAELMDFTHARLGGFPLERSDMDLRTMCEHIANELRSMGATIDVRVSGNSSGVWDAERLGQALSNIVGNAVDHADPETRVTIDAHDAGPDAIAITVANRGPAIPEGELAVIFEPFRRGEKVARPGHLGLGLYIAREIVRGHGGMLTAESSNGTTTFTMWLPRVAGRGGRSRA